jgi:hypothetical protein
MYARLGVLSPQQFKDSLSIFLIFCALLVGLLFSSLAWGTGTAILLLSVSLHLFFKIRFGCVPFITRYWIWAVPLAEIAASSLA